MAKAKAPRQRAKPEYLATRAAKPGRCKCGREVLRGIDEGLGVKVRPKPIGELREGTDDRPARMAEVDAILANRRTYVMTNLGELWERTGCRIRSGSPRGSIYVEHVCGEAA